MCFGATPRRRLPRTATGEPDALAQHASAIRADMDELMGGCYGRFCRAELMNSVVMVVLACQVRGLAASYRLVVKLTHQLQPPSLSIYQRHARQTPAAAR
jgi:hypothetical protein